MPDQVESFEDRGAFAEIRTRGCQQENSLATKYSGLRRFPAIPRKHRTDSYQGCTKSAPFHAHARTGQEERALPFHRSPCAMGRVAKILVQRIIGLLNPTTTLW